MKHLYFYSHSRLNLHTQVPAQKWCNDLLIGSGFKKCGGTDHSCNHCCVMGGDKRMNFITISLPESLKIREVRVSICCRDYRRASIAASWKAKTPPYEILKHGKNKGSKRPFPIPTTPSVSLSQVAEPFEDFVTLHIKDNVSFQKQFKEDVLTLFKLKNTFFAEEQASHL